VKWDRTAQEIRAAFEKDHPCDLASLMAPSDADSSRRARRSKNVSSYAEGDSSDIDVDL